MSIAVLKKKSRHSPRIAPISGIGELGFALNGTRRIKGVVGPTNLGQHYATTPFRGTEPMGAGGCCGRYVVNIVSSACCGINDEGIIKKSTKNTKGMIEDKYLGTLHGAYRDPVYDSSGKLVSNPNINWVQPLSTQYNILHSQGQHIRKVHANNVCVSNAEPYVGGRCGKEDGTVFEKTNYVNCNGVSNCFYHMGGKRGILGPGISLTGQGRLAKTLNGPGAVPQSEYISGTLLKDKNNLPTPLRKENFPMNLIRNGCDTNYRTPCEAVEAGLLVPWWMNDTCKK